MRTGRLNILLRENTKKDDKLESRKECEEAEEGTYGKTWMGT